MQFPDDENGEVLRRMAASGFDFSREHDVDFFAVFQVKEGAAVVAKRLVEADRSRSVSVTTDARQNGETELKVVQTMLVTHDNITKFERFLGALCAGHGGAMDGWGVMQDPADGGTSASDGRHPARGSNTMKTRLNSPGDELDEAERNFVDGIRQHGWMQTHALDEDEKPGFSFTTGFEISIGHPTPSSASFFRL